MKSERPSAADALQDELRRVHQEHVVWSQKSIREIHEIKAAGHALAAGLTAIARALLELGKKSGK